ncbi:MAG: cell division protein SepF [Selenomonadaceae bacterium]|nr:cell division protein SepF [Selenomonadaceae bacterium]
MGIIDKVCGKIGLMDPEEDQADQVEEFLKEKAEMSEREFSGHQDRLENRMSSQNVVDFQNAASARDSAIASYKMKVIVIEPKSFDDAQEVANCLREKRPVVINFDKTDAEAAKRIIDFISGTTYALNGEIKKVGRNVFLCAPSNVNVSYTEEDSKKGTTEMPWMKK